MKRNAGFTLLEVLISVGIVAVMMSLIWSSTSQTLSAKDKTEKRDLAFHMGRVALRKVSDDVVVAFLAKIKAPTATGTTPTAVGSKVKTFFIGEDQGDQDTLKFTTLSQLRLFKNARESDQCKVQYEVVSSQDEPGQLNLIRRKDPWLNDSTDIKGNAITLVENIRGFNVEYYDTRKREWVKNWDTEKVDWKNRLPFAVRIRIIFPDPEDEDAEIPLSTAVLLALAAGPIEI